MHPLFPSTAHSTGLIAAAIVTLATATVARAAAPQGDLELHGTRLRADCRADAWPASRAAIEQAAGGRDAPQLGSLLRSYLCDEGAAAEGLIRRHAPARILQRSEGTGEIPTRRRVAAAEALAPRGGQVYGLQVRRESATRIQLHWQADEACVHGVSLMHRATAWTFVEAGSACD